MAENSTPNPFDNFRVDRENQDQSLEWFMKRINELNRATYQPSKLLQSQRHKIMNPYSGKFYLFKYDALTKDTLRYWDTFPLIIFLHRSEKNPKQNFMGLNLHYINVKMRLALLKRLFTVANTQKWDATKRLKLTYSIVMQFSQASGLGAQNCIKQYRFDCMRSPFLEIPSSSWNMISLLNLEKFNKASSQKVWADSRANR